jgi:putative peptide zinc metalloprotease protein
VTTALFAIAAYLLAAHPLIAIVLWRLAILSCVDIVVNLAPILQVDGHWALADWLDEPDLGPRARRALGGALRRRLPREQRWLAAYGGLSLLAGVGLIVLSASVFWVATGDLVVALFTGNLTDVLIGVYYVGPLIMGLFFSTLGLLLELVLGATQRGPSTPADPSPTAAAVEEDHQP